MLGVSRNSLALLRSVGPQPQLALREAAHLGTELVERRLDGLPRLTTALLLLLVGRHRFRLDDAFHLVNHDSHLFSPPRSGCACGGSRRRRRRCSGWWSSRRWPARRGGSARR